MYIGELLPLASAVPDDLGDKLLIVFARNAGFLALPDAAVLALIPRVTLARRFDTIIDSSLTSIMVCTLPLRFSSLISLIFSGVCTVGSVSWLSRIGLTSRESSGAFG